MAFLLTIVCVYLCLSCDLHIFTIPFYGVLNIVIKLPKYFRLSSAVLVIKRFPFLFRLFIWLLTALMPSLAILFSVVVNL